MNARAWPGERELRRWWHGLPAAPRSPTWPLTLAVLTILALLLGFHSVVASAVQQGEALRSTALSRSQAQWRCHALNNDHQRARCLADLEQAPASPIEIAGR
ncbi:hypothetical protein [Piscinibacter terrae]|uniref:Uncharacterized protein n=1 Tax=Piscinibacter terrae TaxID=2496871 RepID=A0A3N7HLG4_9BURK|nr:hypothetical protein [Albitalea terrae]RQP22968.1 hypothetical protein DZC73_17715 [Albitalea terrae]